MKAPLLVAPLAILLGAGPATCAPAPAPGAAGEAAHAVLESASIVATMTLLDAGTEPRGVLRFTPRAGAVTTLETTQEMTLAMQVPGQTVPAMPPMGLVTTARTTVGSPDATGATRIRFEQLAARSLSADAGRMAAAGTMLQGMTFDFVVSREGRIVGTEFQAATGGDFAAAAAELAKKAGEGAPMFPSEAVGPGARWATQVRLDIAGLALITETESRLRGVSGPVVDLDVTMVARLDGTEMSLPGLPPEAKLTVTKLEGSGQGTQRVDLATLATTMDQRLAMDLEMLMSMDGPGQVPTTLAMHMDHRMSTKVVDP